MKYILILFLLLNSLFLPAYAGINDDSDCYYTAEALYNFSELRENKVPLNDIILELFQYGIENEIDTEITQSWIVAIQYIYARTDMSSEQLKQSYLDMCLSEEIV